MLPSLSHDLRVQTEKTRINLPLALIRREIKLRGDLRLFLRMNKLFSMDARP